MAHTSRDTDNWESQSVPCAFNRQDDDLKSARALQAIYNLLLLLMLLVPMPSASGDFQTKWHGGPKCQQVVASRAGC